MHLTVCDYYVISDNFLIVVKIILLINDYVKILEADWSSATHDLSLNCTVAHVMPEFTIGQYGSSSAYSCT